MHKTLSLPLYADLAFQEINSPFSGIKKKKLEVLQRTVFLFELRHKILGSNLIRLDALRRHFSQRKKVKGREEGERAVSKNNFTKIKLVPLASEAGDLLAAWKDGIFTVLHTASFQHWENNI